MKKIIAVLFAFITVGSAFSQQLGTPTPLQRILNELPAIPIAGRNLKFQFGGTAWIATVNGENVLAGTIETVDISGGSILTLKQTHVWAGAVGRAAGGVLGGALGGAIGNLASMWVATPGPEIVLDYNSAGPRATLSMASEARVAEARAVLTSTAGSIATRALSAAAGAAGVPQAGIQAAEAIIATGVAGTETVNPNISNYYVVVNGMQTGPYDAYGLRALVSQGQLTKNSLVWKEGMTNWIIAGAVEELAPLFSPASSQPRSTSSFQKDTENTNTLLFSVGAGIDSMLRFGQYDYSEYAYGTTGFLGYFEMEYSPYVLFNTKLNHTYGYILSSRDNYLSTDIDFSLEGKYLFHPTDKLALIPSIKLGYQMQLYDRDGYRMDDELPIIIGGELNYNFTGNIKAIANLTYNKTFYPDVEFNDDNSLASKIGGEFNITESIRAVANLIYSKTFYFYGKTQNNFGLNIGGDFKYFFTRHIKADVGFDYYIQLYNDYISDMQNGYSFHGPELLLKVSYVF